jgi:hypothetical protein
VTRIAGAIPGHLISGLFHFAEYSIFCKVKQALVHATWYGAAIAVTILCSSSRFFIKIVRSSRGMQVAVVLCRTYPVRPPEPTTYKQQSSTMGASVYCRLCGYPSTRGAESFSYYRSMPWIDSTKKIRRKTAGRNGCLAIFNTKWRRKRRISFGLGGIFVYSLVECSNHGVI